MTATRRSNARHSCMCIYTLHGNMDTHINTFAHAAVCVGVFLIAVYPVDFRAVHVPCYWHCELQSLRVQNLQYFVSSSPLLRHCPLPKVSARSSGPPKEVALPLKCTSRMDAVHQLRWGKHRNVEGSIISLHM